MDIGHLGDEAEEQGEAHIELQVTVALVWPRRVTSTPAGLGDGLGHGKRSGTQDNRSEQHIGQVFGDCRTQRDSLQMLL